MTGAGRDLTSLLAAAGVHLGLGLWLLLTPVPRPKPITVVEVDFQKKTPPPPQPPVTPPEPPKPEPPKPEPERKIVKQPRPAEAPRPTQVAQEPPKPVVPVYGLSPSDTVGQGISVPTGNTTMADPSKRPNVEVKPLPPSAAPAGKEYRPVTEEALRRLPEHDSDLCASGLRKKYSSSEAAASGIEGEVVFRIELDETGKIHSIRKLKGLGHGLDEMAMGWIRFNPQCRFTPALGKDGKPAAYVIENYKFIFELDR